MTAFIGSGISAGVSAGIARDERKWRKSMSETMYQRTMKDMRKAGLNPMLAFSQGPSQIPSAGPLPKIDIDTSQLAQTAMQVKRFGADLAKVEQDTDTSESQERKNIAEAINTEAWNPAKGLAGELSGGAIDQMKNMFGIKEKPGTAFEKSKEEPYKGPKTTGISWDRFKNKMLYGTSTKPKSKRKRTGASGSW